MKFSRRAWRVSVSERQWTYRGCEVKAPAHATRHLIMLHDRVARQFGLWVFFVANIDIPDGMWQQHPRATPCCPPHGWFWHALIVHHRCIHHDDIVSSIDPCVYTRDVKWKRDWPNVQCQSHMALLRAGCLLARMKPTLVRQGVAGTTPAGLWKQVSLLSQGLQISYSCLFSIVTVCCGLHWLRCIVSVSILVYRSLSHYLHMRLLFFLYVVDPTCSIRKTQDYVHFLIFSSLLVSRFVPVVSGLAVGHVVALVPVPAECWLCLRRRRCIGACWGPRRWRTVVRKEEGGPIT